MDDLLLLLFRVTNILCLIKAFLLLRFSMSEILRGAVDISEHLHEHLFRGINNTFNAFILLLFCIVDL
jgi:hypothetical protein